MSIHWLYLSCEMLYSLPMEIFTDIQLVDGQKDEATFTKNTYDDDDQVRVKSLLEKCFKEFDSKAY